MTLARHGFAHRHRPRRLAGPSARAWWLELVAEARKAAADAAFEHPEWRPLADFRHAVIAAPLAPLPVAGASAALCAEAFLALGRALAEAAIPARRAAIGLALNGCAALIEQLLHEDALERAAGWQRQWARDD